MTGNGESGLAERGEGMSPIPGMDRATFNNYLTRAAAGDQGIPAAILSFVTNASKGGLNASQSQDQWQNLLLRQAAENLRHLEELIEIKRVERDQLLADIGDDKRQLGRFDRHEQAFQRALAYRDQHGHYELNERGQLADADAEDMLKSWERRTGRKLNRNDTDDVSEALKDQRKIERAEAERLKRDIEDKRGRAEELRARSTNWNKPGTRQRPVWRMGLIQHRSTVTCNANC